MVYHGSKLYESGEKHYTFEQGHGGTTMAGGFFFATRSSELAANYGGFDEDIYRYWEDYGGGDKPNTIDDFFNDIMRDNVYELYVNIRKPFELGNTHNSIGDFKGGFSKQYTDIANRLGLSPEELFDKTYSKNDLGKIDQMGIWESTSTEEFASIIKDKGYDGTFSYEGKGDGAFTVGVLDANQFKSATNNNGDFSRENDDIRYSVAEYKNYRYREHINDIKKHIHEKNYEEAGTDCVIFGNFAYIFDHPRDQRNVTDPEDYAVEERFQRRFNDDGFGIRKRMSLTNIKKEDAERGLESVITHGRFTDRKDISNALAAITSATLEGGGNRNNPRVLRNGYADVQNELLADEKRGEESGFPNNLVKGRKDQGNVSDRINGNGSYGLNNEKLSVDDTPVRQEGESVTSFAERVADYQDEKKYMEFGEPVLTKYSVEIAQLAISCE